MLASSAQDGSGGGNDYSSAPVLTGSGLFFESRATDLTAPGVDGNDATDVFVAVAAQITGVARAQLHADIARAYAARDGIAVEESFAAADHAWRAGTELEPEIALDLLDRALAAAWERSGYRDIAELSMHGLDACARLQPGGPRHEREAHLWLQLVSVEAVTKGQNSQAVRGALRRLGDISSRTEQLSLESAFRCLEASGSGRYRSPRRC